MTRPRRESGEAPEGGLSIKKRGDKIQKGRGNPLAVETRKDIGRRSKTLGHETEEKRHSREVKREVRNGQQDVKTNKREAQRCTTSLGRGKEGARRDRKRLAKVSNSGVNRPVAATGPGESARGGESKRGTISAEKRKKKEKDRGEKKPRTGDQMAYHENKKP